jgi:S-DNA-T family DNA segregation ATPase FtsK/SpoIIIE
MLPGQVLDDWTAMAPRLAQTFDAQECRVRTTTHHQRLELWFLVQDPLTQPIPPSITSVNDRPDLEALPVALREDGLTYRLRLLGTHLLVVGATGSGKGSVIWSLLHAAGPAIRDGVVRVWCLDPKGGMELAPGRGMFARFVYGDPDEGSDYEAEFARMLEDAVVVMRRRQSALRGVTRLHTPTVVEPLFLVVVDELASLTAYVIDRDAKRRIASALSLLLSQGRAVGVTVVGAVQDPRKEILGMRDLFPTRVALRVSEAEHVGLVLGHGARDRGARCDQIPESLPGVGYVGIDGVAEPVRVRFAHVTDPDIAQMVADYAPLSPAVSHLSATGPEAA